MDRYGYLVNPGEEYQLVGNPKKTKQWLILGGVLVLGFGIWWLIQRNRSKTVGRAIGGGAKALRQYPVTAPVIPYFYEGAGLPFGIVRSEQALDTFLSVDNNGIPRIYSFDGRAGGLVTTITGQRLFITEEDWNEGLCRTRETNIDVLETVVPFAVIGAGYLANITGGPHLGEQVYVTLQGEIGLVLFKAEGGESTFVPLDVIDQTPDIWGKYVKPGTGG